MKLSSANINVIVKSCRKAAKVLIRDFGEIEKLQVSLKGPGDFVTASDKKVEKILIEDPKLNQINIELHESFKKANGYSTLEIARKRAALDNVLIPESLTQHKERLLLCGFKTCDIWFRYFNFASLIAIK